VTIKITSVLAGGAMAVLANGAVVIITSILHGEGNIWERVKCQSGNLLMLLAGALSTVAFTAYFQ
jgi:hypothetical protein